MKLVVTYFVGLASGFVTGWAARSMSDSPQGVAVKLLEMAHDAKERLVRWSSLERERLEDMLAEAQTGAGQDGPHDEPSHKDKDADTEKDKKGKDKDNGDLSHNDKDKDKVKDKKDKDKGKDNGELSHDDKEKVKDKIDKD